MISFMYIPFFRIRVSLCRYLSMLRENLKAAIKKSGMAVKEIAAESKVNKRTIDKWIGAEQTEPKVIDFYRVCKALSVTMEHMVDGETGAAYVRKIMKFDPLAIHVPDKIRSIVQDLMFLDEKELRGIRAIIEILAEDKKGKT